MKVYQLHTYTYIIFHSSCSRYSKYVYSIVENAICAMYISVYSYKLNIIHFATLPIIDVHLILNLFTTLFIISVLNFYGNIVIRLSSFKFVCLYNENAINETHVDTYCNALMCNACILLLYASDFIIIHIKASTYIEYIIFYIQPSKLTYAKFQETTELLNS